MYYIQCIHREQVRMGKRSDYSCIILNVIEKLYSYEEYIYSSIYIHAGVCIIFLLRVSYYLILQANKNGTKIR